MSNIKTIYVGNKDYFKDYVDYAELKDPAIKLLVCGVWQYDYDGSLFILFEKEGELYEQYDGHCSCNGFENWSPEKVTPLEALTVKSFNKPMDEVKIAVKRYLRRKSKAARVRED